MAELLILLRRDPATGKQNIIVKLDSDPDALPIEHESLYERAIRLFNAAVRGDGRPAATGEDGIWSLATALAVRDAAASGRSTPVVTGLEA